jgi:hypothetical protein
VQLFSEQGGIIVLFCLFFMAGCGNRETPSGTEDSAIGTWAAPVANGTMRLVLKADNTLNMEYPDQWGTTVKEGHYACTGNTLTFTYSGCMQNNIGVPCIGPDTLGTISGNQLTMPIPYGDGTMLTLTKK